MDIILIPGLWLDADSWQEVATVLEEAGHRPLPLTMPGVGVPGTDCAEIGMADWVRAAVEVIDALGDPVALVGHSGGGNVAYGALDARVGRVSRIVFLDTFPPQDGGTIWEFPIVDGVIPFPGWDFFEEGETADLDAATRDRAAAAARSVPPRVPTDPLVLTDPRRRSVPATMITGTVPAAEIREYVAAAPDWAAELAALEDLQIVQLNEEGEPTGHWPQFSQPAKVADAILAALR
ncbi:alpha/beta fold hydrolase [Microbacterium hominis]|uniref:Alpha/beta hydrolase n=1 Tax=Microbacterium hominis TaxID=162426 RepID=A0A7D4Q849_9MICO|nr:alpha/beta hydrolase [Microbacterium hominis]QKJ19579.1 alpha/beta hydrolase [Microbacterium hominis]